MLGCSFFFAGNPSTLYFIISGNQDCVGRALALVRDALHDIHDRPLVRVETTIGRWQISWDEPDRGSGAERVNNLWSGAGDVNNGA